MMMDNGTVVSRAIEGAQDPEGKYQMYADYKEPAAKIPSHRMLAIRRGAKEEILTFEIELERSGSDRLSPQQNPQSRRRMDAASRRGHRRRLRSASQCFDPDRSSAGIEGPL